MSLARSPLAWILGLTLLSRLAELALAEINTRRLRAQGWREVGAGHYPLVVALHASLLAALALTTPPSRAPIWPLVGLLVILNILRFWTIASLGPYWTTRVLTQDAAPLVKRGPYRFLRHPAYLVATLEVIVLPTIFGDWAIALIWGVGNILVLRRRIGVEDEALAGRRTLG